MRTGRAHGDGQWDGVPLTTVPRQPGTSRLNPLPLSEPTGSAGSVSPHCQRMEMWVGHTCPLPRTLALSAGGGGGAHLATPSPRPTYMAAHRGQVIRCSDANTELWKSKIVPWGTKGVRGWWGTRDLVGQGLTGWAGRTGRMLSLLGVALVKPDCSLAPMVVFCRTSAGSRWGREGAPLSLSPAQPVRGPWSQPWHYPVSRPLPVPLCLGVGKGG